MTFEGANPDQLDSLSGLFEEYAGQLHGARVSITSRVHGSTWRGPAADRFRRDWDHVMVRLLDNVVAALRDTKKTLQDNANQQRTASGEPSKNYGAGQKVEGFLHRMERGVDHAGSELRHDVVQDAKDVRTAAVAAVHVDEQAFKDVVSSPEFAEALGVLQVVSTAAGVLALIPGCEPLLAVSAAASVAILAGHAMQMANTGKWNWKKLGEDGLDAGLSAAGAGFLGASAKGAAGIDMVAGDAADADKATAVIKGADTAERVAADGDEAGKATDAAASTVDAAGKLTDGQKAVLVVRGADVAVHAGQTTANVSADISQRDYHKAAVDSLGYLKVAQLGGSDDVVSPFVDAVQLSDKAASASQGGIGSTFEAMGQ